VLAHPLCASMILKYYLWRIQNRYPLINTEFRKGIWEEHLIGVQRIAV